MSATQRVGKRHLASGGRTDTLTLHCPVCDKLVVSKRVACGTELAPSQYERWHLRVAAHIRREHIKVRAADAEEVRRG